MASNQIRIEVKQGGPVLSDDPVLVRIDHVDVKIVEIDMRSKYCEVLTYGYLNDGPPHVMITASERSLNLSERHEGTTEIEFPDMIGWMPYVAELTRYTLRIVFVRD